MVPEKDSGTNGKGKGVYNLDLMGGWGSDAQQWGGSDWSSNWQSDDWAPPGLKSLASLEQKPVPTSNRFDPICDQTESIIAVPTSAKKRLVKHKRKVKESLCCNPCECCQAPAPIPAILDDQEIGE